MSIKSSPIAHQDEDLEISNSSFLNLSSSNENHSPFQADDLENPDQPMSFREEYGAPARPVQTEISQTAQNPYDYTQSQ